MTHCIFGARRDGSLRSQCYTDLSTNAGKGIASLTVACSQPTLLLGRRAVGASELRVAAHHLPGPLI